MMTNDDVPGLGTYLTTDMLALAPGLVSDVLAFVPRLMSNVLCLWHDLPGRKDRTRDHNHQSHN